MPSAPRGYETTPLLLTVNAGSSSIKCALFTGDAATDQVWSGAVTGIGTPAARMAVTGSDGIRLTPIAVEAGTHRDAVRPLVAALEPYLTTAPLAAIVHRVVHGGEHFNRARRVSLKVVQELRQLIPLAPNHLPEEIALIETFLHAWPQTPQVVCFDTAFHRDLPLVSRTLPVPQTPGLRRYGFHGLSYAFLLGELEQTAGVAAARGRVVLAHLGSGASLAAVLDGRCVDTSMGLT